MNSNQIFIFTTWDHTVLLKMKSKVEDYIVFSKDGSVSEFLEVTLGNT